MKVHSEATEEGLELFKGQGRVYRWLYYCVLCTVRECT